MNLAVDATAVSRRYGGRWALRGVDLKVETGRAVMVCGANGSGKTTLLRILATAIRPTGGELKILGHAWGTEVRPSVCLLSHLDGHYDDLTARENLDLTGLPGVEAVLAEVGLDKRADDRVRGYSAGMRKRLAFARVLLKKPPLVLLDEPYAALDPEGARFVDALVGKLRAGGTTLVVSTHQVVRASALCDDAVKLDLGRVVWTGTAKDVVGEAG